MGYLWFVVLFFVFFKKTDMPWKVMQCVCDNLVISSMVNLLQLLIVLKKQGML